MPGRHVADRIRVVALRDTFKRVHKEASVPKVAESRSVARVERFYQLGWIGLGDGRDGFGDGLCAHWIGLIVIFEDNVVPRVPLQTGPPFKYAKLAAQCITRYVDVACQHTHSATAAAVVRLRCVCAGRRHRHLLVDAVRCPPFFIIVADRRRCSKAADDDIRMGCTQESG